MTSGEADRPGGTVLFARHGRTAWNDAGRLQGWLDPPLSERGRREAIRVATAIERSHDVDAVVTSPLRRASETAASIADRVGNVPVREDRRWRERRFGHVAGSDGDAVFTAFPAIHPRSPDFDPAARPPGGESVEAVLGRVCDGWTDVADRARNGDSIVVVTHTTPIRLALGLVQSRSVPAALRVERHPPGTVVTISVDDTGQATVVELAPASEYRRRRQH